MRKITTMFLLAACVLSLSSCRIVSPKSYGEAKFKRVKVKPFRNINVAGSFNVVFEQGERTGVAIKAPQELLDQVSIVSDGKTLVIDTKERRAIFIKGGSIGYTEPVTVYVSAPDINGIAVSGPTDFQVRSSLTTDNLKVSLTGSGDIDLRRVKCQSAELWLTGSGDMEMRPIEAETIKATLTGSGDISVHAKDARMIETSVSGSGDVYVACLNCDQGIAAVTGSGDIQFDGQINDVKQTVSGSGNIRVEKKANVAFLFEDNDSTLTDD